MDLKNKIEALLFVSSKALAVSELADFLEVKKEMVKELLEELLEEMSREQRGWRLFQSGNKYQLASAPEMADQVAKFLKKDLTGELSRPSLETLTIIAYRGPISKLDLDRLRGVNCSLIIRNLSLRALIEENFDKQKNENYYMVSVDFLRHLGLNKVEDLPDYEKLKSDDSLARFLEENKKDF